MKSIKKRYLLILVTILIASLYIYNEYGSRLYVKKQFIKMTGITEFETKSSYSKENYSVLEMVIPSEEKKKILAKFNFVPFPIKPNGKIPYYYKLKNESEYLYFFDDKGQGTYGYVLYFISKKGNDLVFYENFDD